MQPAESIPTVPAGTVLTFMWDPSKFFVGVDPKAPLYIAMINQDLAPIFQEVSITGTGMGTVKVPEGAAGAAFAVLTTFAGPLTAMELSQFGTLAVLNPIANERECANSISTRSFSFLLAIYCILPSM
jgi:hypothetical protein